MDMDRDLLKTMRGMIWEKKEVKEATVKTFGTGRSIPKPMSAMKVAGLNSPVNKNLGNVPGSNNISTEKEAEKSVPATRKEVDNLVPKAAPEKKVKDSIPTKVKDVDQDGDNDLITGKTCTQKNVSGIAGVAEGKIPKEYNMSNPQDMIDLLEAQKTHGAKVDLVANELFGYDAKNLSTDQWSKVKKVIDLVSAEPKVEEPVSEAPVTEDVPAEVVEAPAEEALEEKKEVKK